MHACSEGVSSACAVASLSNMHLRISILKQCFSELKKKKKFIYLVAVVSVYTSNFCPKSTGQIILRSGESLWEASKFTGFLYPGCSVSKSITLANRTYIINSWENLDFSFTSLQYKLR